MNSRWATLVAASLVAFASLVITWQIRHYNDAQDPYSSLSLSILRGEHLAGIFNIVDRSRECNAASGTGRYYDLVLPKSARVFMTDMTGPTNHNKMWYYIYTTYYLFPREIGVSMDQPTRMTYNGFLGRTSESDEEILTNGFDVRFDFLPGNELRVKTLWDLRSPTNPAWFNSNFDTVMAFLLPWLTAMAGTWLFRFLFSTLSGQMSLLEQLAYSLGLGMMAVAALTLGVKLCGFHGRGLIFMVTAIFVSPDFANWSGEGGRFDWIGRWDGLSSLYNHLTLGLPWLCLLLTVALWFAVPTRRQVVIWMLVMFIAGTVALSGVFTSLITVEGLDGAIWLSADVTGGRYLLPILLAWFATIMTAFFMDQPSPASTPRTRKAFARKNSNRSRRE
jgi:hypothetical protein